MEASRDGDRPAPFHRRSVLDGEPPSPPGSSLRWFIPIVPLFVIIAVGYGVVRLIADGFYYLTGREGMGYGDGVILAVVGALLGWRGVVVGLFGGAMLGTVIAVPALLVARARGGAGEPPAAKPDAPAAKPDAPAAKPDAPTDEAADDADAGLARVEVPFGPFLAMAALFWWFAAPYVTLQLLGQ